MADLYSQNEIAHERDGEQDAVDQGAKKKGTRGTRFTHVVYTVLHLHIFSREGKDKRAGRRSPDTPEYVSPSPTGEHEESQGVNPKAVPAIEPPEAASREISHSHEPQRHELHAEPSSYKPKTTPHPNNLGRHGGPGGQRSPAYYDTANRSRSMHPDDNYYNAAEAPTDSATGYAPYGINDPYHQSNRPHRGHPTDAKAYFSNNCQMSNDTQIVGFRSSGRTGASDQDIKKVTANWELRGNSNYGLGDQVVGQTVLEGGQLRQFAGHYISNQNHNSGEQVVGADF